MHACKHVWDLGNVYEGPGQANTSVPVEAEVDPRDLLQSRSTSFTEARSVSWTQSSSMVSLACSRDPVSPSQMLG